MQGDEPIVEDGEEEPVRLAKSLNLFLSVLFGLGVTVGAGIYVLIGATAGRAGANAPIAFVLAAIVMAPTALAFAEWASRLPVSAGEAAYVDAGFGSQRLALLVGLMVITVAVVAAAAITRGSAGYLHALIALPKPLIVVGVVLSMGAIAAFGIVESVVIAGLMTLVEIGGLMAIIGAGLWTLPTLPPAIVEAGSGPGGLAMHGALLSAALLSFFAFIGFEGLANIAEEVKEPEKTLPRAIILTLVITTMIYVSVVWIAIRAVPIKELATSEAPLSLVFTRVTGASPVFIDIVAVIATINGIIAQMVTASRVIFGLAERKQIPVILAYVNPRTRTPLIATAMVVGAVLALALGLPLEMLADTTARMTLVIFLLVNLALVRLKRQEELCPAHVFAVPAFVPKAGALLCLALLIGSWVGP